MEEPQEKAPEEEAADDVAKKEKAAITINIQSWATPIIALLMLIVGFFAGFYLKPGGITNNEQASEAQPTVAAAAATEQTQADSATNDQLMSFLTSQERHTLGDPDAPVTIFGFSDFQ